MAPRSRSLFGKETSSGLFVNIFHKKGQKIKTALLTTIALASETIDFLKHLSSFSFPEVRCLVINSIEHNFVSLSRG